VPEFEVTFSHESAQAVNCELTLDYGSDFNHFALIFGAGLIVPYKDDSNREANEKERLRRLEAQKHRLVRQRQRLWQNLILRQRLIRAGELDPVTDRLLRK
jgi:hypothetical protein